MMYMKELNPQLIELYNQGETFQDIAEKLDTTMYFVKEHIKKLIASGELQKREKPKRKPAATELPSTEKAEKKHYHPNNGVFCDEKVAKQCVYGVAHPGQYYKALCNYCEIEGHIRGCDPCDCTKFEQITEDNPRRYSVFDNGYVRKK